MVWKRVNSGTRGIEIFDLKEYERSRGFSSWFHILLNGFEHKVLLETLDSPLPQAKSAVAP